MNWLYFTILNIAVIILLHDRLIRRLKMIECNVFFTARVRKGYTQMDVSRMTGISQQLISKIENDNDFNKYQFGIIKKLCECLTIDIRRIKNI